jgi:predicted kinase
VVARNARENFEQSLSQVGSTVSQAVFARLRSLTDEALERLRPVIEARARRGVPRDTHGDLHLDHVYLFPERRPPDDLVVIDCIEFNERFRYADPVADMAFLVMDLLFHGRRDLARAFADAYFRASADEEGRILLPFYTAYRAAVRGKVEGMAAAEKEVPEAERAVLRAKARAHWLLALGQLEAPSRKPCLLLVGGLPGAGKSTLARGLAERAGFRVIRSDVRRKQLAGAYSPEWNDRVYADCLRLAGEALFQGERVLVDASFREEARRRTFLDAAVRGGVPGLLIVCRADPQVVRQRLEKRRGDASDADWNVYQRLAARWEEPGKWTRGLLSEIHTDAGEKETLEQALGVLRGWGLSDGSPA